MKKKGIETVEERLNDSSLGIVSIEKLRFNELNKDMSMNDIDVLEESIKKFGVLTPITVYYDRDYLGKFTVLSGHRRVQACKNLGIDEIPIKVVDAPQSESDKFESLYNANIARNSEEDKSAMIAAVAKHWESLVQADRAQITVKLKNRYLARGGDPDDFRPRDEYIRAVTGINLGSRSITRKLAEENKEEVKEPAKKKAEKAKAKARTFKDFCKGTCYEVQYLLSENAEEELPIEIREKLQEVIELLLPYAEIPTKGLDDSE